MQIITDTIKDAVLKGQQLKVRAQLAFRLFLLTCLFDNDKQYLVDYVMKHLQTYFRRLMTTVADLKPNANHSVINQEDKVEEDEENDSNSKEDDSNSKEDEDEEDDSDSEKDEEDNGAVDQSEAVEDNNVSNDSEVEKNLELLNEATKISIESLLPLGLPTIPIKNLSLVIDSLASEEKKNTENILLTLDELKWTVVKSVKGFESNEAEWNGTKRDQLLARGLQSVLDIKCLSREQEDAVIEKLLKIIDSVRGDFGRAQEVLSSIGIKLEDKVESQLKEKIALLLDSKERNRETIAKVISNTVRLGKEHLQSLSSIIQQMNIDSREPGDKMIEFMWVNLLLRPSKRYQLSQLSGFTPGFVSITMEALDRMLNLNDDYKALRKRMKNDKTVSVAHLTTIY